MPSGLAALKLDYSPEYDLLTAIHADEILLAELDRSLYAVRIRRLVPFFIELYKEQIEKVTRRLAENKASLEAMLQH